MVTFSPFPSDPRPRRAVEALLGEGMSVDLICLHDGALSRSEKDDRLNVSRLRIAHRRGGFLSYAYQYSAFISASAAIVGVRSLMRPYDLVYVHNMPDILVTSSLMAKARGAKVILDMHDPMPELMSTIFGFGTDSVPVRVLRYLEKWSMARADSVLTVNTACKRIFASRSCSSDKIHVVMNSPDDGVFPFHRPEARPVKRSSEQPFVIMYHGSIVERNGLDLAVEAFGKVHHKIPGAELRIYGTATPFLEQVLNQVRNSGLHECVTYKGPKRLEDLVTEIEQCDVGIIPNQRNAFTGINTPTRIFEYLSQGKPVVVPRTQGILDYFDHTSLLFFEPGDSDELAAQIQHVALHPNEAVDIVTRGQQVYMAHSWRSERQTLVNLVGALVSTR